jgi:hypothetical protein
VIPAMERSLAESMARMRIPFVNLFILHSPITPDERPGASWRTPLPLFREVVRPALVRLVNQGRIGGWASLPPTPECDRDGAAGGPRARRSSDDRKRS